MEAWPESCSMYFGCVPPASRIVEQLCSIDTTLTPPGAQHGAILGNPEQRNPLRNAGVATLGIPCNACWITRNEQVSGSSLLVGSLFYLQIP